MTKLMKKLHQINVNLIHTNIFYFNQEVKTIINNKIIVKKIESTINSLKWSKSQNKFPVYKTKQNKTDHLQ
jgi:hypothetical protein